MGDYNRAYDFVKKALQAEEKTYRQQMWLGQLLNDVGLRAKVESQEIQGDKLLEDAEKAFRTATELEPKLPETWLSLIQFLTSNQETVKAEKAVEEAGKKIPPEQAPLAMAQAYEIMERNDLAKEKYEAAMTAAPQDLPSSEPSPSFYLRTGKLAAAEAQLQKDHRRQSEGRKSGRILGPDGNWP